MPLQKPNLKRLQLALEQLSHAGYQTCSRSLQMWRTKGGQHVYENSVVKLAKPARIDKLYFTTQDPRLLS